MKLYKFSKYTKQMYLNSKSRYWSYFNLLRLKKLKKIIKKYNCCKNVIEFGAYDLFFITNIVDILDVKRCNKYYFTDCYERNNVLNMAKYNLKILNKNNLNIDFKIISSYGEVINEKIKEKFDTVFVFETLEHVKDEKKVISNINYLLDKNGYVFVGAPKEFGLFFLLKEIGRKIILGKTNHSFREMMYAAIGKMSKVKRIIGGHKGYDYRKTIKMFEKQSIKLKKKIYYPNKYFSYGVILVFKKE